MAHAEKYEENLDKMTLWLQLSEDKLKKAQPQEWNKEAVGKALKELQVGLCEIMGIHLSVLVSLTG